MGGGLIEGVRTERLAVNDDTPLAVISAHRDANGEFLDTHTAAVEVLNVLRPTVAIAYYVAFIAHALQGHPEYGEALQAGDDGACDRFVDEIRRF